MQPSFPHDYSALSSPFVERSVPTGSKMPSPFTSTEMGDASAVAEDAKRRALPLWKRGFDIACILLTCVFWLPLMLLLMVAIRIVSPGPVFYKQARVGFRGKVFMIYKFRSMKINVETRTHEDYLEHLIDQECPMTKLDAAGDPRLIPLGKLLRALGLDELPQIFNVLRGEMSLIGPRPCTVKEIERYQPWQRERLLALPGMTGLWQVSGKNRTTFCEMVALDIRYARHISFWGDLVIVAKTPCSLVRQLIEIWYPPSHVGVRTAVTERILSTKLEETPRPF